MYKFQVVILGNDYKDKGDILQTISKVVVTAILNISQNLKLKEPTFRSLDLPSFLGASLSPQQNRFCLVSLHLKKEACSASDTL
jgi:hypothetical protein